MCKTSDQWKPSGRQANIGNYEVKFLAVSIFICLIHEIFFSTKDLICRLHNFKTGCKAKQQFLFSWSYLNDLASVGVSHSLLWRKRYRVRLEIGSNTYLYMQTNLLDFLIWMFWKVRRYFPTFRDRIHNFKGFIVHFF